MTEQMTPRAAAAHDGPLWVYFVAYTFNNSYGSGTGNQFISCQREATAEDIAGFAETIVGAAQPGTRGVVVSFYNLVRAPAPDPDDLLEIAVQAAAREAARHSPVVGAVADFYRDPIFRGQIAAAVTALTAAGHIR